MVRIEGAGVVLRPLRLEELDDVVEGRRRLGREAVPGGRGDIKRLSERIERSGKVHGGTLYLGIQVDARLVGEIQTYDPPGRRLPRQVHELGIAIYDENERGRGVGTTAVSLLVTWLFEQQGAQRVQAAAAETNRSMRRVFEKLGFRLVGALDVNGVAELMYAVDTDQWTESGAMPELS